MQKGLENVNKVIGLDKKFETQGYRDTQVDIQKIQESLDKLLEATDISQSWKRALPSLLDRRDRFITIVTNPKPAIICNFCKKSGHVENKCYAKQRQEDNRRNEAFDKKPNR